MPANAEQTKQKIAIELENARLAGAFFLPIIATLFTLAFIDQFLAGRPGLKIIFGSVLLITLLILFLYRVECLRNTRKFIDQL